VPAAHRPDEVEILSQVWVQHFQLVGGEVVRRDPKDRPPGAKGRARHLQQEAVTKSGTDINSRTAHSNDRASTESGTVQLGPPQGRITSGHLWRWLTEAE
jgi:hypothetical protein